MKNFSKAVVLSLIMLGSGNALALTKKDAYEMVNRLEKIGAHKDEVQKIKAVLDEKYLKVYLLTPDLQKIRNFVLTCSVLIGDATTPIAKTIAALKIYKAHVAAERAMLIEKITAATNATLAQLAVRDLDRLITEIDILLTRIPQNYLVWHMKERVRPDYNSQFEKITAEVILNDALYKRISTATIA